MVTEIVRVRCNADAHKYAESSTSGKSGTKPVLDKLERIFPDHKITAHDYYSTSLESLENPDNHIYLGSETSIRCENIYGGNLQYLKNSWSRILETAREFRKPPKVLNALTKGDCTIQMVYNKLPKRIKDVVLTDILKLLNKHGSSVTCIEASIGDCKVEMEKIWNEGSINMEYSMPFRHFQNFYKEKHSKKYKMFEF